MKKYLFAMMIVNASLFACADLEEDEALCTRDYCYEDLIEEESDSGDVPENQDNELIAWM